MFGKLLSEAMDDTIREIFGDSVTKLIYRLMERHVSLKREKIAEKFEVFYSYLEKLLGSEGAQIIQTTSLKRLYLNLWREYEEIETYFLFLDELYEIKFNLLTPSLNDENPMCN